MFLGKRVLKICRKFTGEHPRQSAISIKLHVTLLKLHFDMSVLLYNYCKNSTSKVLLLNPKGF